MARKIVYNDWWMWYNLLGEPSLESNSKTLSILMSSRREIREETKEEIRCLHVNPNSDSYGKFFREYEYEKNTKLKFMKMFREIRFYFTKWRSIMLIFFPHQAGLPNKIFDKNSVYEAIFCQFTLFSRKFFKNLQTRMSDKNFRISTLCFPKCEKEKQYCIKHDDSQKNSWNWLFSKDVDLTEKRWFFRKSRDRVL